MTENSVFSENETVMTENSSIPETETLVITSQGAQETNSTLVAFVAVTCPGIAATVALLLFMLIKKGLRRPTNYLTVNLLVSSLLLIVLTSVKVYESYSTVWDYAYRGDMKCHVVAVLYRIPTSLISLTTMAISLERSRAVRNPLERPTRFEILCIIWTIWIASILLAVPRALSRKFNPYELGPYKCKNTDILSVGAINIVYVSIYTIISHIIPAMVLMIDSYKMKGLLKTMAALQCSMISNTSQHTLSMQLQLTRTSFVFKSIFVLCWLPYGVFQSLLDIPDGILSKEFRGDVREYWNVYRWITYVIVTLHPMILVYLSHCKVFSSHSLCQNRNFHVAAQRQILIAPANNMEMINL